MQADVILPAAGTSERMNLPVAKQFLTVLGKHILAYTIDNFYRFPWIRHIVVVVSADQIEFTKQLLNSYGFTRAVVCAGSHTRHRSIHCGLKALKSECSGNDVVIIHDAARPFVPEQVAKEVTRTAFVHGAAGVTRPLVSTVIRADDDARLVESLDRRLYTNSEMPQAFHYSLITSAYEKCSEDDLDYGTECLLLALKYSQCRAALVSGTDDLWKVTYSRDVYSMESIVKGNTDAPANTFVILCNMQMCTDHQTLHDNITKISACYNLDLPSSAVKLDLMVVIVFLQSFSQSDFWGRVFDTNGRTVQLKSLMVNVESPSTSPSDMHDSLRTGNKTETIRLPHDVRRVPDSLTQVSLSDTNMATTSFFSASLTSLYPTPSCQTKSSELPSVMFQQTEFNNSQKLSLADFKQSASGSNESHSEDGHACRSFISHRTVVQMVKENVQRETGGKFALVVGVSCRSAISEQLAQLVCQRSLYTDGQILSF
ncbi:unnamed protein product [Candidula unifasciata]|uniref:2-C-methyl-D-erythritol 4-phosphate cytidylyltransferase-like protein n=1 Tax=Candidula unifasciata TaxID=100452 RepID=A0A8S3YTD1_9EUPU|nr:unnamed protein product [Candidula unifasciata]